MFLIVPFKMDRISGLFDIRRPYGFIIQPDQISGLPDIRLDNLYQAGYPVILHSNLSDNKANLIRPLPDIWSGILYQTGYPVMLYIWYTVSSIQSYYISEKKSNNYLSVS